MDRLIRSADNQHMRSQRVRFYEQKWIRFRERRGHLIVALLCDDLSHEFLECSPEDLLDAGYIPSLWAVQKMALLTLVSIVIGPLSLAALVAAGKSVHRHLANAPRKRKPHVRYPVRALF